MIRGSIARWLALSAAVLGIFLNWSTFPHVFDVEAWREEQIAKAQDLLDEQQEAAQLQQQQITATPGSVQQEPLTPVAATPTPPANGALALDCDVSQRAIQTGCQYRAGATFSVQVHVITPPIGGYYGFQAKLAWPDANVEYLPAASAASEALWPDCTLPARTNNQPNEASVLVGCVPSPPLSQGSTFTGPVLQLQMRCQADGVARLSLAGREGDAQSGTHLLDSGSNPVDAALAGATVTCGETPPPSATATPEPLPTPSAVPTEPPVITDGVVEQEIGVSGGMIESADGRLKIQFPDGAVDERLRVRIGPKGLEQLPPLPDHPFLSIYHLDAFAVDRDDAKVEEFKADIRITVEYTPEQMEGRNPDTMRFWTWNEEKATWEPLPTEHEPYTATASTEVDHFSVDGITADPAVIAPPFTNAYQTDLHTGASQLSFPIDVPQGPGGITPGLALSYSSNQVNDMKSSLSHASWVGTGWNLGAGGAIVRQFTELPSDPDNLPEARYFLAMNGVADQLIEDDQNPGVWHTKNEQFFDIRLLGPYGVCPVADGTGQANPPPPCYWRVRDKAGTEYLFGAELNALGQETPNANSARYYDLYWGSVDGFKLYYYQWDLNVVRDTHDNRMVYTYAQHVLNDCPSNQPQVSCQLPAACPSPCQPWIFASYPWVIDYGMHAQSSDPTMKVVFSLGADGPPAGNGYPQTDLRADSPRNTAAPPGCNPPPPAPPADFKTPKAEETRRLDAINVEVKAGSTFQLVRRYRMYYETTAPGFFGCAYFAGRLKLGFVKQFGKDWATDSEMPFSTMSFDYYEPPDENYLEFGYWSCQASSEVEFPKFGRLFLQKAHNGFGGAAEYQYEERRSAPCTTGKPIWGRQVVKNAKLLPDDTSPGATDVISTDYKYGDPTSYSEPPSYFVPCGLDLQHPDYVHEEFRGFGKVTELHADDSQIIHEYFTTVPECQTGTADIFTGRERYTMIKDVNGAQLRWTANAWGLRSIANYVPEFAAYAVNFVYLDAVEAIEGSASFRTRTQYQYDSYGNVAAEKQFGKWNPAPNDITGDERTVWRYHHMATGPWISVPITERVYEGLWDFYNNATGLYTGTIPPIGQLRSATTNYYDGNSVYNGFVPAFPVTKGELTGVERHDGSASPPAGMYVDVYYDYDAWGNKTEESVPTTMRIAQYGSGMLPSGVKRTTWTYDGALHVYPAITTDPVGDETGTSWDLRMGVPTANQQPNGYEQVFEYDQYNRLLQVWDRDARPGGLFITTHDAPALKYEYMWDGPFHETLIKRRSGPYNELTLEFHCNDGFGREVQVRKSFNSAYDSVVQIGYNASGQVSYTSEPFGNGVQGERCNVVDPNGLPRTTYGYNGLGEVVMTTYADGTRKQFTRNGLWTVDLDENNIRTDKIYDAYGRLETLVENTAGSQIYAVTAYNYDTMGNLVKVIDGSGDLSGTNGVAGDAAKIATARSTGNVSVMYYDILGRKIGANDPDAGLWLYGYDVAGNVTTQASVASGKVTSLAYDDLNRMTYKCYTSLPCGLGNAAALYQYDSNLSPCSDVVGSAPLGQLTYVSTGSGDVQNFFCYDVRGRVIKESTKIDGVAYDVTRTYDTADRPDTVVYLPNPATPFDWQNETVKYTYDDPTTPSGTPRSGLPTGLARVGGVNYVSSAQYDFSMRPLSVPLGNGRATNYEYYAYNGAQGTRGRLKKMFTELNVGNFVQSHEYMYDLAGNVTQISDTGSSTPDDDNSFSYDHLNRLTGAQPQAAGGYAADYAYDQIGNLTRQGEPDVVAGGGTADAYQRYQPRFRPHVVQTVDNASPPSSTSLVKTYSYDSSGNQAGVAEGSATQDLDTDGDGCTNAEERGSDPAFCGQRDPSSFLDFADLPIWNAAHQQYERDCVIAAGDLGTIVNRYGASDSSGTALINRHTDPLSQPPATGYHPAFDKAGADGAISAGEIGVVVAQYGNACGNAAPNPATPTKYYYDQENRLTKALDVATTGAEPACGAAGVTCYTYDAQGALAKKTVGADATVHVSGLYEKNLTTGIVTKYYTFGGGRVAMRECPSGQPGTVTYLLGDHLGSTSVALDEAGAVDGNQKYYPYGRLRGAGSLPTDKLYTGHQKEGGSLYFMQSRFYDASTAGFLSADTIVPETDEPAAWNRYAYVYGNPLRYTDPTGHHHMPGDEPHCNPICLPDFPGSAGIDNRPFVPLGPTLTPEQQRTADYLLWAWQYNLRLNHFGCWLVDGYGHACVTPPGREIPFGLQPPHYPVPFGLCTPNLHCGDDPVEDAGGGCGLSWSGVLDCGWAARGALRSAAGAVYDHVLSNPCTHAFAQIAVGVGELAPVLVGIGVAIAAAPEAELVGAAALGIAAGFEIAVILNLDFEMIFLSGPQDIYEGIASASTDCIP